MYSSRPFVLVVAFVFVLWKEKRGIDYTKKIIPIHNFECYLYLRMDIL